MEEQCRNCRHFAPPTRSGRKPECRRYPPVPVMGRNSLQVTSKWPEVRLDDCCGEFAPGQGAVRVAGGN